MASIDFPTNPTDAQKFTSGDTTYTYVLAKGYWDVDDSITILGTITEKTSLPEFVLGSVFAEQAKIQASDAEASDFFGYSSSISDDGNTAIVGAYVEDTGGDGAGAAYIFTRSGTTWSQQAKILASDPEASDLFGASVSLSTDGNTAIVGAYREDTGGTNAGAAYIFTRSGTSWTQQAKIQSSDKEANDSFGRSVSVSGDGNTLVVGAFLENALDGGAAYIFTRSGTSWTQQAKIVSSDIEQQDFFGEAVSISSDGNTAIVGAYREGTGGSAAGAVYIFVRSGTSWSQQAKIQSSVVTADDNFGKSVGISSDGNTAIVGVPLEDTGAAGAGAAYIFTRSGTTWSETQKILASDPEVNDNFGISVSISSDGLTAIIGAYAEDTGGTSAGSSYIFTRSGSTWTEIQKIQATDKAASDQFGNSVSISSDGSTAIVGAQNEDGAGAAYIFVAEISSIVLHDISQSSIFSHSGLTENITANFTNVPTTNDRTTEIELVIEQGATGYLPTAIQINDTPQSFVWENGVTPTPSINASDVVKFTLLRSSDTWTVLASLTRFTDAVASLTFNNTTLAGITTLSAATETTSLPTFVEGVDHVAHDISQSSVFLHSGLSADFTANFTNVPTTNDRTTEIELVIEQGAIGYLPTAMQIAGTTQSFVWENGTQPDPSINASDVVKFTLLRSEGAWSARASLTRFTDAAYPARIALTDLSVGAEATAAGDGAVAYDNSTGVFTYTPPVIPAAGIALTDLSVGAEGTASGDGAVAYDNSTGVFTYTPPVSLPDQTNNTGAFLTTDGSSSSWDTLVSTTTSAPQLAATLVNPNDYGTSASDQFGTAVTTDGTNVYVVAAEAGAPNGGRVVYVYNASTKGYLYTVTAPDATSSFGFGYVRAADGYLVVPTGDIYTTPPSGNKVGRVHIFNSADGSFVSTISRVGTSTSSFPDGFDNFGTVVGTANGKTIVGAYYGGLQGATQPTGEALLYDNATGSLLHTFSNPSSPAVDGDNFGRTVAMTNNYILIGANGEDQAGANRGAVYVYDATTYALIQTIYPTAGAPDHSRLSIFDITLDTTGEYFHSGHNFNTGKIYEIATGTLALNISPPAGATAAWGVNGSAITEEYVIIADPSYNTYGRVHYYDRTTGAELFTVDSPASTGTIGLDYHSITSVGTSVFVSNKNATGDGNTNSGEIYVIEPPVTRTFSDDVAFTGAVTIGGVAPLALTDISVGAEGTASGDGAIAYDNSTGVFTYTPPISLPDQTNNTGAFLTTDGSAASWDTLVSTTKSLTASTTIVNPNAYGTAANDVFGGVVATDGTYVATAATEEDRTTNEGIVYVHSVATGALVHTIEKTTTDDYTNFGQRLSLADGYLAVGMDTGYNTFIGTVEIFNIVTGGLVRTLTLPSPGYRTAWGRRVATKNGKVLIGASRFTVSAFTGAGMAELYDITTGSLLHTFDNPNPALNDFFGEELKITDDYIIISAPLDDTISSGNGVVYVYDATSYALLHTLYSSDTSINKKFGNNTSTDGTLLAVQGSTAAANQTVDIFNLATGVIEFTIPVPAGIAVDSRFGGSGLHMDDDYIFVGAADTAVGGSLYVYNKLGVLLETIDNPNSDPTSSTDAFTGGYEGGVGETTQQAITSGGGKLFVGTANEQAGSSVRSGVLYSWDSITTRTFSDDAAFTGAVTIGGVAPLALTDISVGAEATASGDGAIAYDNTTGVFTYTPPVIAASVDSASVEAAGALMDSELTDIVAIKALDQGVATTDSPSFAGLTLSGVPTAPTAAPDTSTTQIATTEFTTTAINEVIDTATNFVNRIYTGDGVTDTFVVTSGVTSESILVSDNGVVQRPVTDYSVSGTTLTFVIAPPEDSTIQIREIPAGIRGAGINTGKAIAMSIVFGG